MARGAEWLFSERFWRSACVPGSHVRNLVPDGSAPDDHRRRRPDRREWRRGEEDRDILARCGRCSGRVLTVDEILRRYGFDEERFEELRARVASGELSKETNYV